jgi:hypothetical protein
MKLTVNTHMGADGILKIYLGNRLFVEVADGRRDEDFVEEIINSMGYDWLPDGTIRKQTEEYVTKESLYDEMCRLLTEYEDGSDMVTEYELYDMLVKIQRHWEDVITVQND